MSLEIMGIGVTLATVVTFALVGLWQTRDQGEDLEAFMVSRNRFGPGMALATVVSSALGAWILFSPPEVGATSGVAGIMGYCIGQGTPAAIFAMVGPRIRFLMPQGHSLNEYVLHRFGNAMYGVTLGIIAFYMFVYLTAELTAIAKAVELMTGTPLLLTALLVMGAVFVYTTAGGLAATIFTDAVQFVVIVPLLLISFGVAVVALGGWSAAIAPVLQTAPELLDFSNGPGQRFGLTLVIAIIAAEMFNQANWQRIYACRNDQVVRLSFLGSFLVIVPLLFIAGLLGILGMHFGFADDRTFFSLIQALALPTWVTGGVLVLVLALVMSSLDTLVNGIASVLTTDLLRLFPHRDGRGILRLSQWVTVAIGIPAIVIAAQGFNVLYLFLLADLVCAGALFPVLYGLYARRLTGTMALVSTVVAIAAGALFFPRPDFSPWTPLPGAGDLLVSFLVPIVVSILLCLGWIAGNAYRGQTQVFNFAHLSQAIRAYGSPKTP